MFSEMESTRPLVLKTQWTRFEQYVWDTCRPSGTCYGFGFRPRLRAGLMNCTPSGLKHPVLVAVITIQDAQPEFNEPRHRAGDFSVRIPKLEREAYLVTSSFVAPLRRFPDEGLRGYTSAV